LVGVCVSVADAVWVAVSVTQITWPAMLLAPFEIRTGQASSVAVALAVCVGVSVALASVFVGVLVLVGVLVASAKLHSLSKMAMPSVVQFSPGNASCGGMMSPHLISASFSA
jgi:hypothetical protein